MSEAGSQPKRQRWRAPAENGTALVAPPLEACCDLLRANRERIAGYLQQAPWSGFAELQAQVRQDLLRLAREYTAEYADVKQSVDSSRIFLSGHQPELFHPGVWFKNFLLSTLAKEQGGVAINLIIDNDTERGGAIGLPATIAGVPQRTLVSYDAAQSERPFEERSFKDDSIWQTFPERVATTLAAAQGSQEKWDPLVHRWHAVASLAKLRTNNIGRVLAEGRHRLEIAFGLRTWEQPLSRLCQQPSFITFVQQLLANLPRLHEVYNVALHRYRRENRVRSHSHPAPDLEQEDEWFEVPLWMWSVENPTRRRVFARRRGDVFELSDRAGQALAIPVAGSCDPLAAWEATGVKLRPRALLTTLFTRLLACDCFVHGIGGAKYDEVTEQIAAGLWQVELPRHITATATLRLPFRLHGVDDRAVAQLRQRIRDLNWHAEKQLPASESLVVEKGRLIANEAGELSPRQRAKRLEAINEQLRARLPEQVAELLRSIPARLKLYASDQLMGSREFSFVLHSEKILCQLLDLCWQKS